jgi:AcrR family transcriptional regulator
LWVLCEIGRDASAIWCGTDDANGRRREVMDPPGESAATRKPTLEHQRRATKSSNGTVAVNPKRTQRERLLDAMVELCAQAGYQGVSIEQLCARAGVSPATFYEQFDSKEACLLAAYRAIAERIFGQIGAAAGNGDWSEAAHAALGGLLRALQSDPHAGQVLFIEGLAGGPGMREERSRVLSELELRAAEFLDSRPKNSRTLDIPVMAVIGALRHIVSRRLRTHAADQLPSLEKDVLSWLESYAIPTGATRWSTGPNALLEGAPEQEQSPASSGPSWTPERLPPGRHGLSAEVIARSQRTRLIFGTAEVMMGKGYQNATIADIVAAAGVARPVFYEHFTDKQHAFLEAQQYPTQFILDRCAEAYYSAKEWPERVWRCFETLIGLIVANPAISHLRLVECYAAGPTAVRLAEEITRSFTIFLEEGYYYREDARSLPRLCSQAIAGAFFEIVQRQIAAGDPAPLAAHLPQLTYIAIAPFTGAEEAVGLVEEIRGRSSPPGDRDGCGVRGPAKLSMG